MKKILFLLFLLTACSLPVRNVGDMPSDSSIALIKKRMNKNEVYELLGSPAGKTLFEKESWIYMQSQYQTRAFLSQKEISRDILVISFDGEQVSGIKRYTLSDAVSIDFDDAETQAKGKDLGIIDELIGNFGRFAGNPSAIGQ